MPTPIPQGQVVPISSSGAGPSMPATPVYHYVHPVTGDQLASLLPPNHPAMICVQEGRHINQSSYGILGKFILFRPRDIKANECFLPRHHGCYHLVPVGCRSVHARPPGQVPTMWTDCQLWPLRLSTD
jgi:hypothetical protein